MSKMIETLKNNGWEMSTLGQCQLGDEVLTRLDKTASVYTTVCGEHECEGSTVTEDGIFPEWTPVLRSPRSEYKPGTVALIWRREDQTPVQAWKIPWYWVLPGGVPLDDDTVEVIRVLFPADQDSPTVEVTDEMVERGALGLVDGDEWPTNEELGGNLTGTRDDEFRDSCRDEARRVLEAALGVEKEK